MNNRYLYRAKQKSDKKWIYGNLIRTDDGVYIIQNYVPQHLIGKYEVDPSTICQCTGLKNKNGKLIWENDIVRYNDMITGVEKIDRIEWNETHASFVRLHRSKMGLQYLYIDEFIANECEVIGSAIDNPELLEVGE